MTTKQGTTPMEPITNPPGGGSWQWDADTKQWIPRDQPAEQPSETQE